MASEFPVEQVLRLACAAQRVNKEYLKTAQNIYAADGKFLFVRHDNKSLVKFALGTFKVDNMPPEFAPEAIFIQDSDIELASNIRSFYKRLVFAAVEGENEFLTEVNFLLNSDTMGDNKIGFIACLPSVYARDYSNREMERRVKTLDEGYAGDISETLKDKDCEILECNRSKNFDAWNVYAIIDNKMVSWLGKKEVKLGPAVLLSANVKGFSQHWKHNNAVTRLNYVKVFQ